MKQILCLITLLLLVGCGGTGPTDEPPEIVYSQDLCDSCGMIIDEPRFAAAYVLTTGEVRKFESIEDMVSYHQQHQDEVHLFWVHDYESEEWVRADQAYFIQSDYIQSPMGGGLIAAASETHAHRLADVWHGTLLTFADLMDGHEAGESHSH
ncbi:MAG: nitrous oxide reductase accessory protein NosL [Anaerolineae bacterium]|nr:nitrous oxide reductase accessory protein NosL [Anaerolineae bacterium]